ncbi:MAG: hypothetical protein WCB19_04560 [Thermoplasmata archaeon]
MTAGSDALSPRDLDPLSTSSVGTALAGAASLVWPELVAGAISLAAVASFVVWIRALRALRTRRATGYRPVRLLPFLALGGAGWSAAVLFGPIFPPGRALLLGGVSVGLWFLARSAWAGI